MPVAGPSFRRLSRRDAAVETQLARWIAARLAVVRVVGTGAPHRDPYAARVEVRVGGLAIGVAISAQPIRTHAQRLLGGPSELPAPRPLTVVEEAIAALVVAAALEAAGIAGEVWPLADARDGTHIELAGTLDGLPVTAVATVPPDALVRVPPSRPPHGWAFDWPIVVGRCALARDTVSRLSIRDVITVDRVLELAIGQGGIGLAASPGALEARVATEYVPRDMALPDDAHVELTVQLGTARLTLRQLGELVPGQIIQLGRPLAGPYEIRAAGRRIGEGELVDVDGELGVRIVSIDQE